MKKVFLVVFLATSISLTTQAQGILDKAKTVAASTGFDVNSLTKSITSQLTTKLGLSQAQIPKVTSAVSTFMQAKSEILPLLQTDKTQYTNRQSVIFGNLKTALTGALLKNQMNKFLALKPATNSTSNVLSSLFY